LTKDEILQLFDIITDLNTWLIAKRVENNLAQHVQFPKTPPALSEAIALNLLRDNILLQEIEIENLQLGRQVADIIGTINGQNITIEIKATTADFQYLGINDIQANFLIWINLVNPLRNDNGNIDIYIVPNPAGYFPNTRNITLNRFLVLTGATRINYQIDIFDYLNE